MNGVSIERELDRIQTKITLKSVKTKQSWSDSAQNPLSNLYAEASIKSALTRDSLDGLLTVFCC